MYKRKIHPPFFYMMRDSSSSLVQMQNVEFSAFNAAFPQTKGGMRKILYNININIQSKEMITIIGPNGAGKTTLLKLITGLLHPTQGVITRAPHLRIGYVPQKIHFPPLLPLRVWDFMRLLSAEKKYVLEYLAFFRMEDYLYAPMYQLSGGELQKILLVHSALLHPELLVLDEPSQGVDIVTQSSVYQFIDMFSQKTGCGVILVSHDLHIVMAKSHAVYCLNGHICCHGHPEDVRQHPGYQGLFGGSVPSILAPYHHHHDHHHNQDGSPCEDDQCAHKTL